MTLDTSCYSLIYINRILNRQEVLNSATETSKQRRDLVKRYKKREQTYFQHSQDRERLAMRVKLLQQQLDEQEMTEETGETMVSLGSKCKQ